MAVSPSTVAGRRIGGLTPTDEQTAVIDACVDGLDLVIEAGAGTGKTSTLRMAASRMHGRGLYVAYNRAIVDDARRFFPPHVNCSTAHRLAYREVGHLYNSRLDGPRLPAIESARRLGITSRLKLSDGRMISRLQLYGQAVKTVNQYCRSADDTLTARHVPPVDGFSGARGGWLPFKHDHYLKMWSLTEPVLDYDFLLLDEAQDADPLIASILKRQSCQRIAVGDSHQAIYHWRGAVDALENWPAAKWLYLSQSWRFGPAIAEQANKWLTLLGAKLHLVGAPDIASTVADLTTPQAVLCRTNAEAINQVIHATDDGRSAALVGGGHEIRNMAQAALDLQSTGSTDHAELFAFKSWGEVHDYAYQDEAGAELLPFVRLVGDVGAERVVTAVDELVDETAADVIVSTSHKAKGREWSSVLIGSDFHRSVADSTGRPRAVPRADAMLAYVAVTRARDTLDCSSLAWIDALPPQLRSI